MTIAHYLLLFMYTDKNKRLWHFFIEVGSWRRGDELTCTCTCSDDSHTDVIYLPCTCRTASSKSDIDVSKLPGPDALSTPGQFNQMLLFNDFLPVVVIIIN